MSDENKTPNQVNPEEAPKQPLSAGGGGHAGAQGGADQQGVPSSSSSSSSSSPSIAAASPSSSAADDVTKAREKVKSLEDVKLKIKARQLLGDGLFVAAVLDAEDDEELVVTVQAWKLPGGADESSSATGPVIRFHRHAGGSLHVETAEMQGRRASMEDRLVALRLPRKPEYSLFGVFDGHRGEDAASFLAHNLPSALTLPSMKNFSAPSLESLMLDLDTQFLASMDPIDVSLSGTTSCFALVRQIVSNSWQITVCNLGDSRALLVQSNGEYTQLTIDHKPEHPDEARRIQHAGGTVTEHKGCFRIDRGLAMSRAFGDWSYKLDSQLPPTKQKVVAVPDVSYCEAHCGDSLLIGCDGLWEKLTNGQIAQYIQGRTAKSLLAHSFLRGSKDNMSCVLVRFGDNNKPLTMASL